ncbi:hypothetical protein UK23_16660 [Lentzea aerocolonigenes]|uniref:Uncharacterized protein n=1 Tax=Lentzea aerocolonigenes TaxID=68170 RepID=A0A0F0H4W1_LENAE|nr:hypothetical protein [Lentzea aerocolonigenes]KJK48648.1 hypothetical protein UK23_16660 [Lentzea aerocolonigenes]
MRALRLELRRSLAPWAGMLLVATAVALLYSVSAPWWKGPEAWDEQWHSAAQWIRFLLVFLWPLVVGAGAVAGLRDHRAGIADLLTTAARPPWRRAAVTAGALAIYLVLGYLTVFALGAVQVIWHGGYFHLAWLPITAVGALAVVAGGWLGMGVARAFPSVLTPPLLAVSALVALVFLTISQDPAADPSRVLPNQVVLLSPALSAVRNVYDTVAAAANAGQAIWLAGLALTGFGLLVATSARLRLIALVPAVAGFAIALPVLPARTLVLNESASAAVCREHVCLTRMRASTLDSFAPVAEHALRLLATLPDAPTSVREVPEPSLHHGGVPRRPETVPVLFNGSFEAAQPGDWLTELVAGAGTPTCFGESDDDQGTIREAAARAVAAAWFTGELKPVRDHLFIRAGAAEPARRAWEALRVLPPDQQLARVSAARAVGLSCQGDQLTALTGGTL